MRSRSAHDRLAAKLPGAFAALLDISTGDLEVHANAPPGADFLISAAGQTFVLLLHKSHGSALIVAAAKKVSALSRQFRRRVVPILVVPFMGAIGRHICDEASVGWFDLSGNAHIIAPGMRVIVDGRPNLFRSTGRPPNLFAAKSSRVARCLLVHYPAPLTQRQIAQATDMTEGFVSRIVRRLEHDGYLIRDERGAVCPKDPALLLDTWREAAQFARQTIFKGHVATRSGDALLRLVSASLSAQGMEYAATGLAAAWALTRFAAFRITTVYLPTDPSPALLEQLGCREDPRGANLWLVIPNDRGVFQGGIEQDGIRCVHPVQVYIDLKDHPERAPEAAERLRAELLTWRRNG